jgi:hypothetical protein
MKFFKCDPRIYRSLRVRQVGTKFVAGEDLSAVEVPVLLMLNQYSWPDKRYIVELTAGAETIGVQHETTKRDAVRTFGELKRRKELWCDPERPDDVDVSGSFNGAPIATKR